MAGIDASQQLALVEAEGEAVIPLPRSRLPGRAVACHHRREAIEVRHHAPVHGLVEGEQPHLVREQLPDGDVLLPVLRELRPVSRDAGVVVQPTA